MNITFDKEMKQRVWQMLKGKIENKSCPFCAVVISGKNFAGAAFIDGEFRAFDGNIVCLIQLSDHLHKPKRSRFHIHWFKPIGDWTGYVGIKRCRCGERRQYEIY